MNRFRACGGTASGFSRTRWCSNHQYYVPENQAERNANFRPVARGSIENALRAWKARAESRRSYLHGEEAVNMGTVRIIKHKEIPGCGS